MKTITAAELRVGDIIVERSDRGQSQTPVRKREARLCGVHINDSTCYNAPSIDVTVLR